MQLGLGISAIVLAIVSIFIPIVGVWTTILAGALAAFSFGKGFPLGLSSIVINAINIFFLSPSVWLMAGMNAISSEAGGGTLPIGTFLLAIQAICLIVLFIFHSKQKGVEVGKTTA